MARTACLRKWKVSPLPRWSCVAKPVYHWPMTTLNTTPAADGFHMPGEFEPHSGCWILWPERTTNWRLGAKPAQQAFAAVATAIATGEPVTVGVSRQQFVHARSVLPDAIRVVELSSDDAWMRDVGPTFVVDRRGDVRGVDWPFNGWGGLNGGLYFPWDQDDLVARKVLEIEGRDRYRAPLILEGGAIHVDGEGTLITTEECLMNPNRNPHLDKGQIEILLHEYLGVTSVIWLGKGVVDDETNGHVDNLCSFVRPGEVVLTWTENKRDPQYRISLDAYERLSGARDAQGRRLKIHKLQQPGPMYRTAAETAGIDAVDGLAPRPVGERLAGSYVNFYVGNSVIVLPLLDPRHDKQAARQLQRLFPGRRLIGVQAREILLGGGNIHCITQQVPAGRRVARRSR
jgi:agmatine deiminase